MPAIVNGAVIREALVGHRVLFDQGLKMAKPIYKDFVEEVPSTSHATKHHFAADIPSMRKWTGERVIHGLEGKLITIENEDYELTIGIPKNDYEDDNLGVWRTSIQMMGFRAEQHPDALVAELLNSGFVTTGPGGAAYDGVAFFSTAHPRSVSGNNSNKMTSALDADALDEAILLLRSITDDQGEPMGLVGSGQLRLTVPPALEATAKALLNNERLASGASNPHYNAAELVVNDRLTSDTAWFLDVKVGSLRPLLHQVRRKPKLIVKNAPTDDGVFYDREVVHGVDGRYAVAYGRWWLMVGSDGTT